ncbi:MAG TPA: stalk domain-containing protein, partial [Candidatus Marinimicrobia bacterium]|nr:stalk domain-containing protein [Candidatus Neomarinimicrobiota bacterium]
MKIFRPYIYFLLFLVNCHNLLADQLVIQSPHPQAGTEISIIYFNDCAYFSTKDFAQALGLRTYNNPETGKIVLYFSGKSVKITAHSAFVMLDTRILQMSQPAILVNRDEIFVPLYSFLDLMKRYVIPKFQYHLDRSSSIYELVELPGATQAPSASTVTTFGTKPGIIYDIQF